MKIYLAAPYAEMFLMRKWDLLLIDAGHVCTSRWVHGNESGMTQPQAAQMDLDDVDAADAVVLMAFPRGTPFTGGGRCVEFGYALARDKLALVVMAKDGDLENIFHHLPQVVVFRSIEDVVEYIK